MFKFDFTTPDGKILKYLLHLYANFPLEEFGDNGKYELAVIICDLWIKEGE
jgi:hypothetical protein